MGAPRTGDGVGRSGAEQEEVGRGGTQWDAVGRSGTQWDAVGRPRTVKEAGIKDHDAERVGQAAQQFSADQRCRQAVCFHAAGLRQGSPIRGQRI